MAIVAMMAIVLGFGAELQALRRLQPSIVSVLLALDPAVAFAFGWIAPAARAITSGTSVGLVCVVVAGVGVTYDAAQAEPTLVL